MQVASTRSRLAALPVLLLTLAALLLCPDALRAQVKYVYAIDYPLGKKDDYLKWVRSNAEALQSPPELQSIASYDNYFGASPNRVIEFTFADLEAAAAYFERPAVRKVIDDIVNFGLSPEVTILRLRGDYAQRTPDRGQVKYVYTIDYPLAQKAAYLSWVVSVAPTLQSFDEVKRILSYDNYFGATPHRFIEFEFDSMAQAAAYFERPEVTQILDAAINHGVNSHIAVLQLRSDYDQ